MTSNSSLPSVISPSQQSEESAARGLDLRYLVGVLFRRWKLVVAVPIVSLLAAHGILKLFPPVYQSTVQILMFEPQQRDLDPTGQTGSAHDFDIIAINTEIEIIKSQSILLRVVKDLQLDEDPEFQGSSRTAQLLGLVKLPPVTWLITHVRNLLGETGPDSAANDGQTTSGAAVTPDSRALVAANILRTKIAVERMPLSYILVVSARSRSPKVAQQVAERLLADYFADKQKVRQKAFDQMAIWLTAKLSDLKARAIDTGGAIEKLKAENGFGDTGKESDVERQAADLKTQLAAAHADAAEKKARLEIARQLSANNLAAQTGSDAAGSSVISQLRLQQSLLTEQASQLRAKFGDSHASVVAITAQLARVNQAMNDEAARVTTDLQNSYNIAINREESLKSDLQRLADTRGNSEDYVKLQQLQRSADAGGKVYDTYLSRFAEIESSKSLIDTGERIISPAAVPDVPVAPRRGLILAGSGGAGVALGVLLAFALDYFAMGIRMGADAEQAYGYPVIGNVPLYRQGRAGRRTNSRTLVQAVVSAPLSPFSEAVRTIRLGLRLTNQEQSPKVILVTSSLSGEGKSTLSTLLAASSAAAGHRTVLVDCDVRGRAVTRDFGTQEPGLTDLLSGAASLAEVTVHDPDIGCAVITAGSIINSPGDLLASPRMNEIMARLREEYDYIVVDTPPLLSVVDALALAAVADKILVTIDGRSTRHVSVAEAFRLLRPETKRIAGIVFNKVAPEQLQQYGMYPYSRFYS